MGEEEWYGSCADLPTSGEHHGLTYMWLHHGRREDDRGTRRPLSRLTQTLPSGDLRARGATILRNASNMLTSRPRTAPSSDQRRPLPNEITSMRLFYISTPDDQPRSHRR